MATDREIVLTLAEFLGKPPGECSESGVYTFNHPFGRWSPLTSHSQSQQAVTKLYFMGLRQQFVNAVMDSGEATATPKITSSQVLVILDCSPRTRSLAAFRVICELR